MMRNAIFDTDEKFNKDEDHCNGASSQIGLTQKKLNYHFRSSLNDSVCEIMAKEIHCIKSPAVQTMIDVWHQSGAKSWIQWVNNSSLNNLRQNHQETFHELQNYQSQFTQNIYAPLSEYLSSSHDVFKGTANNLIKRIFAVYNHLKLRKIAPNCCLQIDMRSRHDIFTENCVPNIEELEWNDNDQHGVYENDSDKIDQSRKSHANRMRSETESFDGIMDECVIPDDTNYCYKRYELFLYGTEIKSIQAISNNTVPDCAFDNAPLCMIFNSTASTRHLFHQLRAESKGLITVSFHAYHDSMSVYLYVADKNGQLFGSRIFADDLLSMIPLLFKNSKIDDVIMFELNNYSEFKPDTVHKQYYMSLIKHVVNQNEKGMELLTDEIFKAELDPLFASKLEATVNSWNSGNKYIINTIKKCFIENNVNYEYFENHTRKHLTELLKRYQIKAAVAIKLWRAFTRNNNDDEDEAKAPLTVDDSISTQSQNQILLDRMQSLESQLRQKIEENHDLQRQNHDLKRVIENAISADDDELQSIEHDVNQQVNLSNSHVVAARLSKNDACLSLLAVQREFYNYYQQEIGYLDQLQKMVETASFVLWMLLLLYLYNIHRRYYRFSEK